MDYRLDEKGLFKPNFEIEVRGEDYPAGGFEQLYQMQRKHFWFVGRHKFLLELLTRVCKASGRVKLSILDAGCGAGGWINYLKETQKGLFERYAVGDSSEVGLTLAKAALGSSSEYYHLDLYRLEMKEEWDVISLLDVIEHLEDDGLALEEVSKALKPGGIALISVPAFSFLWGWHDVDSGHKRRYTRRSLSELAVSAGLNLVDSRYFMFYLSPLYMIARSRVFRVLSQWCLKLKPRLFEASSNSDHYGGLANRGLAKIFALETPVGHVIRFPFGTSVVAVFEKPERVPTP